MRNKLLHHLLQGVLVIHDHLAQPGVLPVTDTHVHNTIVTIETIKHVDGSENSSIVFLFVAFGHLAPCVISWA